MGPDHPVQPAPPVPHADLTDAVVRNARHHPEAVAVSWRTSDQWHDVDAATWHAMVVDLARGLHAAGVRRGDRVVLLSRTRWEWTLVDYAVWWIGAVTVPVYETARPSHVRHIVTDCDPVLAVVETPEHAALVDEVRPDCPHLARVVEIDGGGLDDLVTEGRGTAPDVVETIRRATVRDDLATIIYTSGTTGLPKGCMLTHGNLLHSAAALVHELDVLFRDPEGSTLLFLPLAHVFARVVQVAALTSRTRLGHTSAMIDLPDRLQSFRPTFVLAVPRVFERAFNRASQEAVVHGRARTFDRAVAAAISASRALDHEGLTLRQRTRLRRYDASVYASLRDTFGGRLQYAVSVGAPLGEPLAHFLRGAGLPVLEGYGLTETSAAVTLNRPGHQRVGTVGPPLPGVEVDVSPDGELLFGGPQVFRGYWRDAAATADAFDGDLLRSGDLGELDDGYVRISGRTNEVLVTSGGKQVSPTVIEELVRRHTLVGQCLVVGDGRPYVAAVVTLDREHAVEWARLHGLPTSLQHLVREPDLVAEVQRAVDDANEHVSQAEGVRRFVVLPVEWSERTGDLTPTQKLRRNRVLAKVNDAVESLYL